MTRSGTSNGGRGLRIQSVERAAEILGYFRTSRPYLTLQEITVRAGLTRATAHRYVTVLRDLDLLRFDPTTNSYTLGSRILALAAAATAGQPMIRIAGPYLEGLVRETNETAVLSVWDGSAPVVLRVDDNTERTVRISVQTGARLPAWGSAHGRVYCSFLPQRQVPRLPPGSNKSEIMADIDDIRRTRLAVNCNDSEGTTTVAAPIFSNAEIAGALAIVGTSASIPATRDSSVAQALLAACNRLSVELGETDWSG